MVIAINRNTISAAEGNNPLALCDNPSKASKESKSARTGIPGSCGNGTKGFFTLPGVEIIFSLVYGQGVMYNMHIKKVI